VLRPGNVGAGVGAIGILSRLLPKLRAAFPQARLRVCLEYVVAMGKNKALERRAARLMGTARRLSRESGQTAHLYSETRYAAGTWEHRRRVIIKAGVVRHPGREPKDNPRFVVTNLKQSPRHLYAAIYCARGDIENRIKELHHGLEIDRTSCSRFLANQLRGLLSAAAYVLYQELRLRAARTAFSSAQVNTLREHLMKLGPWLQSSLRRIVLHLPPPACTATTGRSSPAIWVLRPRSATGSAPHPVGVALRESRRTPVDEINRSSATAVDNQSRAHTSAPESATRIDIMPRHRNTPIHDDEIRLLHA